MHKPTGFIPSAPTEAAQWGGSSLADRHHLQVPLPPSFAHSHVINRLFPCQGQQIWTPPGQRGWREGGDGDQAGTLALGGAGSGRAGLLSGPRRCVKLPLVGASVGSWGPLLGSTDYSSQDGRAWLSAGHICPGCLSPGSASLSFSPPSAAPAPHGPHLSTENSYPLSARPASCGHPRHSAALPSLLPLPPRPPL